MHDFTNLLNLKFKPIENEIHFYEKNYGILFYFFHFMSKNKHIKL